MATMTAYTDNELITLYHESDNKHYAFNLLLQKHKEKAYFFARKMVVSHEDADDVVQEVFIKIWKHLDSFRGDSKFTTWMYTICSRECLNHLRKKKAHIFQSLDTVQQNLASSLPDDVHYTGDAIRLLLDQAILTLPYKQRLVFNLRYFDELPFKEIAAITGTSEGALKASYHLAAKKIEQFVKLN